MDKIVKGYPNWDIPLNANIDEYNATMGNTELLTEDKTVKGAINEIKTGNDTIIQEIKDDTQINTADISNLKTSVAQNTSQLKDITNDKKVIKGSFKGITISDNGTCPINSIWDNNWFTLEDDGRLLCKKSGTYKCLFRLYFSVENVGKFSIASKKNETSLDIVTKYEETGRKLTIEVISYIKISEGDYLYCALEQTSGKTVTIVTDGRFSNLVIERIGE